MYVRLVRFSFGPGKEQAHVLLATDLLPAISAQPACKGALCFGDTSSGEYGLFVQWDSQEHADAASAVIGPRLSQHLAGKVQGQPDIHLFQVIKKGEIYV